MSLNLPRTRCLLSVSGFPVFRALMVLLLLAVVAPPARGIPASPHPFAALQPDGTQITLHVRGDEYLHWFEDIAGFTVVQHGAAYEYATLNDEGELAPTGLLVGRDDPRAAGLAPRLLPAPEVMARLRSERLPEPALRGGPPLLVPPSGTVKNLVVLCMFSDHTLGSHTRPQADFDVLFNTIGGDPTLAPTGSVKDCYLENSYGTMTLNSTVAAWVTLPQTEAYYVDSESGFGTYPQNAQGMVEDALNLVDVLVDFGQFDTDNNGYIDAIDIIHVAGRRVDQQRPERSWCEREGLRLPHRTGFVGNQRDGYRAHRGHRP